MLSRPHRPNAEKGLVDDCAGDREHNCSQYLLRWKLKIKALYRHIKKDYATWLPRGEWTARKIEWSYDIETEWQYRYYNKNKVKLFRLSDNDKIFF